ncbi:MAG TPA: carboxypeptidase M32 [Tepidisphaeraceae bacterium]|jgi:carboxypeptidase Taq
MPAVQNTYQTLIKTVREIALLGSTGSLLGWDERVQMPPKGAEHRANQSSLIARLCHEQFTSPQVGEMLAELEQSDLIKDPEGDAAVNVRDLRREYDRRTKVPASLVEEMSKVEVLAQQAWVEARKKSDFPQFQPWLEKTVDLKRQEASCIGYTDSPYNALLDIYEPHETVGDLNGVFQELRGPLVELIGRVIDSGRKAPVDILERHYPANMQEKLARDAAVRIGFDFDAGRLDTSVHPFCSGIGPGDTRMTTRYDESYFGDAFFGVLHETGHALYDQGLPKQHWGTPVGEYISLGIHESQSRMWENFVGRSRSFWEFYFRQARALLPEVMSDITLEKWYFAVNDIRPTFIRTESDEATYNLHILLRYELEQAILAGDLVVRDIPGAWNEKMKKYLGLTPPDDAKGCLQDIHWAGGSIGYFPTYTLGNLYAAQYFEQARKDIGDLDALFAQGNFRPLLDWLRKNIHQHGRRYRARDLVQRVTGQPLSAQPLLNHLKRKVQDLYRV